LGFRDGGQEEKLAWEADSAHSKPAPATSSKARTFVAFQKGGTLEPAASAAVENSEAKASESRPATSRIAQSEEYRDETEHISDLVEEIVDKLEFLGVGSETVSPLKMFAIQTQTLCAAWQEGDLEPAYFRRWLEAESRAFSTRERESAPPGWTMAWNRYGSRRRTPPAAAATARLEREMWTPHDGCEWTLGLRTHQESLFRSLPCVPVYGCGYVKLSVVDTDDEVIMCFHFTFVQFSSGVAAGDSGAQSLTWDNWLVNLRTNISICLQISIASKSSDVSPSIIFW